MINSNVFKFDCNIIFLYNYIFVGFLFLYQVGINVGDGINYYFVFGFMKDSMFNFI